MSLVESDKQTNLSCMDKLKRYPKVIGLIIGNEFCERFSYYGMRSVLLLYLRNYLKFGDDKATSIYHAFTMFAYFFPLVGGIIADSYLGRYWTIVTLSIVYVFGHALKTIGSIPYVPGHATHIVLSMLGLLFIAIGTGGIKPCVSSFGGDQFLPNQWHLRKQFFSMFYFAINAGSLISMFITPIFRADLNCYPGETGPEFKECYAMAFGVPGALMVVALFLFIAGDKWYIKYKPEGSVFIKMCKCIGSAIKNKWKTEQENRTEQHWIDYADATEKMKRDTKYVLQVVVIFLPIPFFWALFDQQGSRWTLQAIQLNGNIGGVNFKPDQIEVLNPLLILILIPLFELVLYPLLEKFNINFSSLRKMTLGFVLTGISFIVAALLQIQIDKGLTVLPTTHQHGIRIINSLDCDVSLNMTSKHFEIPTHTASQIFILENNILDSFEYKNCDGDTNSILVEAEKIKSGSITDFFLMKPSDLVTSLMKTEKSESGGARISLINSSPLDIKYNIKKLSNKKFLLGLKTGSIDVPYGKLEIDFYVDETFAFTFTSEVEVGAVYTIVVGKDKLDTYQVQDINPNSINVLWIFPQFIIITIGEVFLSITGLEFSYTQAPPSMKSVLASVWLLTVSFGNVIVLIVAESKFIDKQSNEFFLFAGLVFVAGIVFAWLAYRYKPVDENQFAEEVMEEEHKRIANNSPEERIALDTVRQKLLNESVKVQKQL